MDSTVVDNGQTAEDTTEERGRPRARQRDDLAFSRQWYPWIDKIVRRVLSVILFRQLILCHSIFRRVPLTF